MKKLGIIFAIFLVAGIYQIGCASAGHEGHNHGHEHSEGLETHDTSSEGSIIDVGNAICPVSGEFISDVGAGNGVQIEHEGKIYNVCCKFCAKDFKKNPEKFIKIIENNLTEGKDPGRDY